MKQILCIGACLMMFSAAAQEGLIQVHQGFDEDPGWEWKHNRIVAEDPATVDQNFGWAPTNHTSAAEAGTGWLAPLVTTQLPPLLIASVIFAGTAVELGLVTVMFPETVQALSVPALWVTPTV